MKTYLQKYALRIFVGTLFVIVPLMSIILYRYANTTAPVNNARAVLASDTIVGDAQYKNVDSLKFTR